MLKAVLPLHRMLVGIGRRRARRRGRADPPRGRGSAFAGALVLPPFYYKGVSDDGLFAVIKAIVSANRSATDPDLPLLFPGPVGSAVAYRAHPAPHRFLRRAHRRVERFFRRHGFRARRRGAFRRASRSSLDRSGAAAGPLRPFRRLYLGDDQSQCRSLRALLSVG